MSPIARLCGAGVAIAAIAGLTFGAVTERASAFSSSYVRVKSLMHAGIIARIASDPAGQYLVSCSVDKTIKLWDAGSGALLRTFYPPSGRGREGSLYACALSPDASTIAVGGWTGWSETGECSVYLLGTAGGQIEGRISGLPYPVADIAFSRDNTRLAMAFFKNFGVRVYRLHPLSLEKTLAGFDATCSRCVFDESGRLAVASADGSVRVFSPDCARSIELPRLKGLSPYSLSFSRDSRRLAVGYENSGAVTVYSGRSLTKFLRIPDEGALPPGRHVSLVSWSTSSDDLYAVISEATPGPGRTAALRRYGAKDLALLGERLFASGLLLDIKTMPDNTVAFCGVAPLLGRIGVSQGLVFSRQSDLLDLAGIAPGMLALSRTARDIRVSVPGQQSFVFSVAGRLLRTLPDDSAAAAVPRAWDGDSSARLADRRYTSLLKPSEYWLCDAADTAGGRILAGTNWDLYMLDTSGEVLWQKSTPGPVWGVAAAPEAGMCAAALGDGTLRWYRLTSGEEVLSCAISRDRKLWAAWTPDNRWDASIRGSDLLCLCVNHGSMRAAECRRLDRFARDGYDPAAIARLFKTDDSTAAFRPSALILGPVDGFVSSDSVISLRVKTSSPRDAPVTGIFLFVNGTRQRADVRGIAVVSKNQVRTRDFPVELRPGANAISVIACNRWGCGDSATVSVERRGPPFAPPRPCAGSHRLFVLAVGISRYFGGGASLTYADKDARDFAGLWQSQSPCPYRRVECTVLTNESATRAAILGRLSALARAAAAQDVIMLFVAGHATQDALGRFAIVLPGTLRDSAAIQNLLTDKDLLAPLGQTPARVLCFLDACDGGRAAAGFARPAPAKGGGTTIILQASSPFQDAREGSAWNNGAFTKALIEGLSGKADFSHAGVVTVAMISLYVSQRVKELTAGLQTPVATMPPAFADFPLTSTSR